jgi:hypothetical protein
MAVHIVICTRSFNLLFLQRKGKIVYLSINYQCKKKIKEFLMYLNVMKICKCAMCYYTEET